MSAKDAISLAQLQALLDYHGGTAFPHNEGGFQITLSQRLGQRWGMGNHHWMETIDNNHPVISKIIQESKDAGIY